VLVDIDAAIGKNDNNNRKDIKSLIDKDRNKVLAVGGGIRTEEALNFYLNDVKCKKIILSSNL
jgi:phosphoribosylformimino-5-aminoimidazole carboxamide ribonucleotide (ProFAR) isomerase